MPHQFLKTFRISFEIWIRARIASSMKSTNNVQLHWKKKNRNQMAVFFFFFLFFHRVVYVWMRSGNMNMNIKRSNRTNKTNGSFCRAMWIKSNINEEEKRTNRWSAHHQHRHIRTHILCVQFCVHIFNSRQLARAKSIGFMLRCECKVILCTTQPFIWPCLYPNNEYTRTIDGGNRTDRSQFICNSINSYKNRNKFLNVAA